MILVKPKHDQYCCLGCKARAVRWRTLQVEVEVEGEEEEEEEEEEKEGDVRDNDDDDDNDDAMLTISKTSFKVTYLIKNRLLACYNQSNQ